MAADRVEKFHIDGAALVAAKPLKVPKINSEIAKFRKWLTNNQEERLAAGPQGKLIEVALGYYKLASASGPEAEALQDSVLGMLEDLLKIPEGKLISSKSKRTALKWCDSMRSGGGGAATFDDLDEDDAGSVWEVIGIADDGKEASVMDQDGESLEGVAIPEALLESMRVTFDAGEPVKVLMDLKGKKILSVLSS